MFCCSCYFLLYGLLILLVLLFCLAFLRQVYICCLSSRCEWFFDVFICFLLSVFHDFCSPCCSSCLSFLVPSLITFLLIFLSYLLLAGFLDFFGLCSLSEKARNSARFVLPLSILPIKLGKSFWIDSLSRPETFVGGCCSFAETVAGLC